MEAAASKPKEGECPVCGVTWPSHNGLIVTCQRATLAEHHLQAAVEIIARYLSPSGFEEDPEWWKLVARASVRGVAEGEKANTLTF